MASWEIAVACACAAPGVLLGLFLILRGQRVVGGLLVAVGAMPLIVLSPDSRISAPEGSSLHGLDLVLAVLSAGGWIWFYLPPALLAMYFPDGRLPAKRWRWLLVGWVALVVVFNLAVAVDPSNYGTGPEQIPGSPPVSVPEWLVETVGFLALALLLSLLVGSVWCVVFRYRHGSEVVKRQIKWFAFSVALLPLVLVATWVAYVVSNAADVVVVAGLLLVFASVPVTVAIAVRRHDLYDIDRLLSRTVTYTLVTGLLLAFFVVAVVATGVVVGRGSGVAVALATLACAMAFGPLRRRVQRLVDGRFDRDHRDAIVRVARFVDSVRTGTAEPEAIGATLSAALRDPELRVAYATGGDVDVLWRDGDGLPVARPAGPHLDVAVRGRLLASVEFISAGRRPQLLREVLREAHLPLELARSRIELRDALAQTEASRARLLRAGDEERRRLERDLHDGAQQQLVAIGMSLRLVQQTLPPSDPMRATLGGAVRQLQDALVELRRLAGGVRPRALDEGLAPAIRQLVRMSPVPIDVRVDPSPLPDAVATTAYYVAAEAVTNALKHAEPQGLRIDVSRANGFLRVVVEDDGRGGATLSSGSGLTGLRDRVLATGGELVVDSADGRGTRIEARLPCGS